MRIDVSRCRPYFATGNMVSKQINEENKKNKKKMEDIFKVNNKDSRTTLLTLFWYPYC